MLLVSLSAQGAEWRSLFEGDLSGWRHWLARPHQTSVVADLPRAADGKYTEVLGWDRDPLGVVRVVEADGEPAIRLSGEVYGVLVSRETFRDYHLRLEFKWGEKRWPPRENRVRDSGLLYHIHSEPGVSWEVWPASVELQIQEHDCGDLYTLITQISVPARIGPTTDASGGATYVYDPAAELRVFEEKPPIGNRCIKSEDAERPHGEWNTIEIVCLGDDSLHIVNGRVVMRLRDARSRNDRAEWVPLVAGQVALQTEGAEVFYRRIQVRPIAAIPAEFLAK